TAARVNDRWATGDWEPIILDDRDHFERSVAGLMRYDVLFVNPLRDGLNLVAKEGPACNRRDGLLCLSPEAGAFAELKSAAIEVHPYDIEQNAAALDSALATPLDERAYVARQLRELALARTPSDWLRDCIEHAPQQ
ncbi:MAG TPA: trehalose-6-phosphate synthase, partial [Acidimicrobiia bacterium]|nr:trehalose-6-phosphate synthase [Acidimicrobiia bacterium]